MSNDRVHHPYSPSSLQSREACPKYKPSHSDNEASIMGTLQHSAVESDLDDNRIPDYRALAVAQCKEFAAERILSFGPGATVLREEYLPVDDEDVSAPDQMVFKGTTAGYLDLGIVNYEETHAEIIDWKFGRNAVTEAESNLQGIAYMLGLKKKFPKLQTCIVRFIQPHIDHETSHEFQISNPDSFLLRVRAVVLRSVEAAKSPDDFSMARATVGTCIFCDLVGRCPKVADLVIQVGKKYAPMVVPDDISTVTLLDPARVSEGMKLAQVVSTWAESYRKNATQKSLNTEDFIPDGYILVPGQRTVIKSARGVANIAKKFLPPEHAEKVEALFDISLTPLDKLISTVAARGMKEKTVDEFREAIITEGAAEMGNPYAFLRLKTDKDSGKTAKK
jgi:hypothetical protein